MREANRAIKRTPRHVTTVQEMRHKLAGATVFSELDMSHGFHQLKLAENSRHFGTFRTHEGLHRFKVLFFGAAPASDIFHARISEAMAGLEGCMSIHDNILVWGRTPAEHAKNLEACLQRLKEKGLTLRKEKCNFGKSEITWFGWTFTASGMSADQRKVEAIKQAGRPASTDDVKSFLQACQYNAKFMFGTKHAYAQVTWPLRQMTCKGAKYVWSDDCENAYQEILGAMMREDALRPFDPKLPTKLVTDAGPDGLAASLFQVSASGEWIPVDHASRALTKCEQRYSQFEKESLAQAWGMQVHRNYLLGIQFESYTDHKPLLPVYNGLKRGNARVERHKLRTNDFQFKMMHIMGKHNPCDYASRHPRPLSNFTKEEKEAMMLDVEDEVFINRIIEDDLPDAVTLSMLQKATKEDPVSQKIIKGIHKGYVNKDPEMMPFKNILREMTYADGVLLRGERIYIPAVATRWFNKYETIAHIFLNFCRRTKSKIRRESPLNSLQNGYIQDSRKCILSSHMSDEQTTPHSLRSAARTFPSAPPSVGSRRGRSRRCSCGSTPSQQTSRLRRPRTVSHADGPSWGRRGGSRWAPGPGCTAAVASPTSPASRSHGRWRATCEDGRCRGGS